MTAGGNGQGRADGAQNLRPFYFMVPFWGERYRNYFLDYCLASLLAPNNLGLLRAAEGHKFLIATTREDWQAIERLPIMETLRAHATPVFVEIPDRDASSYGYNDHLRYQNVCQKLLIEIAFRDRVYGSLLLPDIIVSDGMVASMLRAAEAGKHLVLCGVLRQTQEPVLAELTASGYLPADERPALTGRAVTVPPRVVADLSVRHNHWEVAVFDGDRDGMPAFPPFLFWYVHGENGLILHTSHAVNVLMDYGAIETHDLECLDQSLLEHIYVGRNFSRCDGIHIVEDSDEFGILSLTPVAVGQRHLPYRGQGTGWFREFSWRCNLRGAMARYVGANRDVVRRKLFCTPIRIHARDLSQAWENTERRVEARFNSAVGDYVECADGPDIQIFPRFPSPHLKYFLLDLAGFFLARQELYRKLSIIGGALHGDRHEWDRIMRSLARLAFSLRTALARVIRRTS
jgi:hypothetical protein